jgi:hypothetical protein
MRTYWRVRRSAPGYWTVERYYQGGRYWLVTIKGSWPEAMTWIDQQRHQRLPI